jgi:hydrogenase maturation protease
VIRVVGLGQPAAGDDAVGIEVVRAVGAAAGVQILELSDAAALVELLDGQPMLVVDAIVGAGPPGTVVEPSVDELVGVCAVSTHGIGLVEAVGLARALQGEGCAAGLAVVGVSIEAPRSLGYGLSEPVAAAIEPAAARVRSWIETVRDA